MVFEIHPLGVRGSFPGSATRPSAFGQDTTCFFLRVGDQGLILDAGSGLTRLGMALLDQIKVDSLALLLTHYHLDHLLGFPFFRNPSAQPLPVHGPILEARGPEEALRHLMAPPLIPVGLEAVGAFAFHPFPAGQRFSIGEITVETLAVSHPGGAIAYKLTGEGRALVFIPDIEHPGPDDTPDAKLVDFIQGCDAVIYDCMFSPEVWEARRGWGHSHWRAGQALCAAAGVPRLIPTHFDPHAGDEDLQIQNRQATAWTPAVTTEFAREGSVIRL